MWLSHRDKKTVDGKLRDMIGGEEGAAERREKGGKGRQRRGEKRGERGAIGMRGGAGGKKRGRGEPERSGEIMYCRLINVKGAES